MASAATARAFFVRAPPNQTNGLQDDTFEERPLEIPELKDGDVLVEAQFISVDPYLMGRLGQFFQGGSPIISGQVARVVESRAENFEAGELVQALLPMATQSVVSAAKLKKLVSLSAGDIVSPSNYLGAMGMPGATAYFGLLESCELKEGDNVLVSGGAGAVGSVVGQIAKLKGCYVVGTAGSAEKCEFMRELGFDVALNYKDYGTTAEAEVALRESFPNGIDVYFDNTGGPISNGAWKNINKFGRVGICGQIAYYNKLQQGEEFLPDIKPFLHQTIYKAITIRGFVVTDFKDWSPFFSDMYQWIAEGKVRARETELTGFDSLPEAFKGLFTGKNIGKMVVNCAASVTA